MKKSFILSALLCLSMLAQAQTRTVNATPGALESTLDGDYAFTELIISGSIDVRDLACINAHATALTSIDMSACTIVAYDSRDEQYLGYQTHFEDNVVPASAFFGFAELEKVVLASGVTAIGDGAFAGCEKLTSVTGVDAVEKIGDYAFSGCTALSEMTFPITLRRIGDYAFDKCDALASVDLSGCTGLTYIGKRAFAQNISLSEILLPGSLNELGEAAFAGCLSLQSVTLPDGVAQCGIGLFAGCPMLQRVDLSACRLDSLPSWTFSGCTELTEVALSEYITSIGEGAFYYCSALPIVKLPVSLDYLDSFAFAGCEALNAIDFMPEGLESIGRYAFFQNEAVDSVVIPATVSYIGDHAFDGCINADRFVTQREMPAELGEMVFANMNVEEKTLRVPVKSVVIYESTAQWQDFGQINSETALEDARTDNNLTICFEQYRVVVAASQEIDEVRLFNTAGVLLAHVTPHTNSVSIDTHSFVDNIYLLQVKTADGHQSVSKVARVIR